MKNTAAFLAALTALAAASSSHAQGLAPPPPLPPSPPGGGPGWGSPQPNYVPAPSYVPPPAEPEREKDSGRGLEFFYANVSAGAGLVGLTTFNSSDLALERTSAVGPVFDVGLGLRLLILTIGPRLRYTALSPYDLWQINAEVAFHIPIGRWDPYIGLYGGYSFLGALSQDAIGTRANSNDVHVRGFDAGLQLGLDYYFTPHLSFGGEFSSEFLAMWRPSVDGSADVEYGKSGGSAGFGGRLLLHGGIHF
ncbi:hypothetical protein LVJ94_37905 [Pendulispora rubella]|uniref:Outer membrane protein beta-barrel domain-containing protein n=1 Tax=Pendulispora rubella TaxID=2741070 RepID=A0ABZ2KVG0_9BACT